MFLFMKSLVYVCKLIKVRYKFGINDVIRSILVVGVMNMKQEDKKEYEQENKKTAGNNQWTNNNTKYYPDTRERKDGPGGD